MAVGLLGAHLVAPLGVATTVTIGRPRLFALSLYAVVGLLVFDALLVAERSAVRLRFPLRGDTLVDWRMTVAMAATYLTVVSLHGRGLFAYGLFSLAALHGVVVVARGEYSTGAGVCIVATLSMVLLVSQLLGIPYFADVADTIKHAAFARSVVDAGTLRPLRASIYGDFPVLHVLVAATVSSTGLSVHTAGFAVVGVLFVVALVFVSLFVSEVTRTDTGALVAAIVVSTSPFFVEYALKIHAQSLSFVFLTLFLFLLFSDLASTRTVPITLLVVPTWVLTHHVSMFMAVLFTGPAAAMAAWWYVSGREPSPDHPVSRLSVHQYSIFGVVMGTHWTVLTATVSLPLSWLLLFSPAAQGLPSTNIYVEVYSSLSELVQRSIPFVVDTLHYSVWLAVVAAGVWYVVGRDRWPDVRMAPLVLPALVLYFPNPAWFPIRGLFAINRWALFALPFVAIVVATGVQRASAVGQSERPSASFLAVVGVLLFLGVSTGMSDPTLTTAVGYQKEARDHLSEQQLESLAFVDAHYTGSAAFPATMYHYTTFSSYGSNPEAALAGDRHRIARVRGLPGDLVVEPGLTVVPEGALAESAVRMEVVPRGSEFYEGRRNSVVVASVSEDSLDTGIATESVVYSSGSVRIIFRPESRGSPRPRYGPRG